MILVFGKNGQLGIELQRFDDVFTVGREQADLLYPKNCVNLILNYKPSAVVNAAAYTAVDEAENNFLVAKKINGDAPKAMAKACAKIGIPFVHISTDYVFKGNGDRAWKTNDQTEPQNAYGQSKLIGEIGVRASGAVHSIIRSSSIISAHSSNFVKSILC